MGRIAYESHNLTSTIKNTSASYDVLVIYYDVIQIKNALQPNRIHVDYPRYYRVTGSLGFDPDGLRWRYSVYTVRIKDIGSPDNIVFPQTFKENQDLSDHMLTIYESYDTNHTVYHVK